MGPLDDAEAWMRFTPDSVDSTLCQARTWDNGRGGQCRHQPMLGEEFCRAHRQKWEVHGCVTGPIPQSKLRLFLSRELATGCEESSRATAHASGMPRDLRASPVEASPAGNQSRLKRRRGDSSGGVAVCSSGSVPQDVPLSISCIYEMLCSASLICLWLLLLLFGRSPICGLSKASDCLNATSSSGC